MNAKDELMYALEDGEITQEQFELASSITFDIIEEDIVLFVQGMKEELRLVKSVSYAYLQEDYDGVYEVHTTDGSIRYYGWYDWDSAATLYLI